MRVRFCPFGPGKGGRVAFEVPDFQGGPRAVGMALRWETQGSRKSILLGVGGVLERDRGRRPNADWYEPGFKTCHWKPAVEILGWGYDS